MEVKDAIGRPKQRLQLAVDNSQTVGEIRRIATLVTTITEESYVQDWLTDNAEPTIIVDLRDTYTVGPFLGPLNRTTQSIEQAWHRSRLERLVNATSEHLSRSRVGSFLKAVVKRPKPPSDG